MLKFTIEHFHPFEVNREIKISISYKELDLIKTKLHSSDNLLFREISKSSKISDQLLMLETLARRMEESKIETKLVRYE